MIGCGSCFRVLTDMICPQIPLGPGLVPTSSSQCLEVPHRWSHKPAGLLRRFDRSDFCLGNRWNVASCPYWRSHGPFLVSVRNRSELPAGHRVQGRSIRLWRRLWSCDVRAGGFQDRGNQGSPSMHMQSGRMDGARAFDSTGLERTPTSAAEGVPSGAGISLEDKSSAAREHGVHEAVATASHHRKPLSFYMAFLCLLIMVFLCSMDSTIMAVSIPVSHCQLDHFESSAISRKLTIADHDQRIGRHYL